MIYRQGDVLVMELPDEGVAERDGMPEPRDDGRIVLAYGEVTGHVHAIADPGADLWRIPGDDRLLVVQGPDGVALVHEEHATIVIPPGTYLVRRQREYVPAAFDNVGSARSTFVAD